MATLAEYKSSDTLSLVNSLLRLVDQTRPFGISVSSPTTSNLLFSTSTLSYPTTSTLSYPITSNLLSPTSTLSSCNTTNLFYPITSNLCYSTTPPPLPHPPPLTYSSRHLPYPPLPPPIYPPTISILSYFLTTNLLSPTIPQPHPPRLNSPLPSSITTLLTLISISASRKEPHQTVL
ncbi:hypothetical protein Pcinc_042554 [Petrolisthes cinctipes]|uniref:Uncharacterized protein n=1 Tax=Petrolisthes cinctipes TaxID=88211 RepID=A0AAE1BHG8_PETCI|nr:hypothetical protein Pcinc_042554 [Petrolisthes cinctipes]